MGKYKETVRKAETVYEDKADTKAVIVPAVTEQPAEIKPADIPAELKKRNKKEGKNK